MKKKKCILQLIGINNFKKVISDTSIKKQAFLDKIIIYRVGCLTPIISAVNFTFV